MQGILKIADLTVAMLKRSTITNNFADSLKLIVTKSTIMMS